MGTEPGITRRLLREIRRLPWSLQNTVSGLSYRLRHLVSRETAVAAPEMSRPQQGSFATDQVSEAAPPAATASAGETVRITCWNIAYGLRYEPILAALREQLAADIFLLQEVDIDCRRTGGRDVCRCLARELGLHYVFGAEFQDLAQQFGKPALHGQAILSRFPISRPRLLRFGFQHDWSRDLLQPRHGGRMALVADVCVGARLLRVYNTHLESRSSIAGRLRQMQEIVADLDTHPTSAPTLIAGDLNTREARHSGTSPVTDLVLRHGFTDASAACRPGDPGGTSSCLDWILVRGVGALPAPPPPPTNASDHQPVTVRIALR